MRVLISALVAMSLGLFIYSHSASAQTPAAKAPARAAAGTGMAQEDLTKLLQPLLDRGTKGCTVTQAKVMGAASNADLYEVACQSGVGAFVNAAVPQTATSAVTVTPCLALEGLAAASRCTLTTPEANMAPFKDLATKAEKPCTVTKDRFVGATSDGSMYFEYACSDNSGFMIKADASGAFKSQIACINATTLGSGCTLTDAVAATASLRAGYTTTAKSGGFDCNVSKFGAFAAKADSPYEAIEIGCDNRADSAVILKTPAKTTVVNCLRAFTEGYRCAMSNNNAVYPALTDQLKNAKNVSKNYSSCDVNNARSRGASARYAYIEVACADGTPGFVIQYALGEPAPFDIILCSQAGGIGGCQMTENQPK